jgi:uncharacterized protein
MILNLHGFASIGNNSKNKALAAAFPDDEIISPTLPINPVEVVDLIDELISKHKEPTIIVGSSFGGFYAFYTSVIYKKNCILINPSMKPWKSLQEAIGEHQRFVTGEKFVWEAEYLSLLEKLDERIKRVGIVETKLNFFLSNDDEVLDHSNVRKDYPGAATIIYFDNCGHRFMRFDEILPQIKEIFARVKE